MQADSAFQRMDMKKCGTCLAGKLNKISLLNQMEESMATQEDTIKTVRTGRKNPEHTEGPVATAIEEQTAKLPSDIFLWVGVGFMALSLGFQIAGKKKVSNFIGHWPVNILVLGLYNKLVKLEGHD